MTGWLVSQRKHVALRTPKEEGTEIIAVLLDRYQLEFFLFINFIDADPSGAPGGVLT